MAAGDKFITCENNFLTNHALLQSMMFIDSNGNPALNVNGSTGYEPYINCEERSNLSIDQLLRLVIVQGVDGNPSFNII